MLTISFLSDGDITLEWRGRSLVLVDPSQPLLNACRRPDAIPYLTKVIDMMGEATMPRIPASFVEGVLQREGMLQLRAD
jgi:hypothetical protein